MIARIWRGRTAEADADPYFDLLSRTGLKDYASTDGNRGVVVLRRISEGRAEFLLISFWESFESIRKFAGPDVDKAFYYPDDKKFLLEFELKVAHYDLLVDSRGSSAAATVPTTAPIRHNLYFEGKVQSLGLRTPQGPATAGVITPGRYTFLANFEERVVITAGMLRVRLPQQPWKEFATGEEYVVPAQTSFEVEAKADVAYVCYYK